MNKLIFTLSILFSIVFISCSNDEEPTTEPVEPIELSDYQSAVLILSTNVDTIKILSGNRGYSLVFPKSILLDDTSISEVTAVPYSKYNEKIMSLHIDEYDNIVIERKSLFDRDISALFMVKDSKCARRLFTVKCRPFYSGGSGGLSPSVDYTYRDRIDDESYWVNY